MSELPTSDTLPAALSDCDQWVCWQTTERDGKQTKVPIDPTTDQYASTTDSSTWSSFEQARTHAVESSTVAGLGFVFTDDDPFVGVDLDNCRDEDGTSPAWVIGIIDELNSYTEVSPSGTGYHVITTGELPAGPSRRGDIECYETARYFTVTGESVHDPPRPVAERTAELAAVHAEHVAPAETDDTADAPPQEEDQTTTETTLDDETVLEKAHAASNGQKFARLWSGSTAGYDSQSEADMALCFQLAFWTGADPAQMDRLFRQSGLIRDKWDEVHFADGATYGERTIERAVARVDDVYDPTEGDETDSEAPLPPTQSVEPTLGETATTSPQQVNRLHGLIDRLEARVESLEAENQALRAEIEERDQGGRQSTDGGDTDSSEPQTNRVSLWERMSTRLSRDKH